MSFIHIILGLFVIAVLFFTGILCLAASDADSIAEVQYQRWLAEHGDANAFKA